MKIIEPWLELDEIDGIKIMKNLELAAKQCYRTQGNITEDSYKNFLKNCITRGHESVLEHEKVSIRMCCDIGVYKDLTRHRHASFSIESTRYCNYSKDKFGNELTFIKPCNIDGSEELYSNWIGTMDFIEKEYIAMSNNGAKPDQLRLLLPHSTAAEVYMTANIREWRHIFSLRAQKETHPAVQQVMIPLLRYFQETMPELFGSITYNKEFDEQKYAKIKLNNKNK